MKKSGTLAAVAALTLLAFALRVFWLDHQSLWFDEGWSWYVATRSWAGLWDILRQVDSHPPLYYAALKVWMALAGQSDFSLRFLSVLAGTLAVPLVYGLGRRLLRWPAAALAAALCLTFSPPHIVYSQEVRMYAAAVTLMALSVYLMLRWLADPNPWRLAAYGLATAAALYTNYFTALVVVFENVAVLGALVGARGWGAARLRPARVWRHWFAAQAAVLAALLCLAPLLHGVIGRNFIWRPFLGVPAMVADAWRTLTLGVSLPTWRADLSEPLMVGLAVFGGVAVAAQRRGWPRALAVALYLAVPVALLVRLGQWRPVYTGRYLLPALVPVALLLGAGVTAVGRLAVALVRAWGRRRPARRWALGAGLLAAGGLGALGVALPFGAALRAYYFDPAYAREDFRAVAAHIQTQEQPGEALILLNAAYPLLHYYQGHLPYVILPADLDYLHDEAGVAAALDAVVHPPARAWVVGWQWEIADPRNLVEAQLREHGQETGERWWETGGPGTPIRVAAYQVFTGGFKPLARQPLSVSFGDAAGGGAIRLVGYHLQGSPAPGQRLTLELWWQLDAQPAARWQVFTHLLTGPDLNTVVAQSDKAPLNDHFPFYVWTLHEPVQDLYTMDVPADAPPGLKLAVGLYNPQTGERLPVTQDGQPAGDRLFLPLTTP